MTWLAARYFRSKRICGLHNGLQITIEIWKRNSRTNRALSRVQNVDPWDWQLPRDEIATWSEAHSFHMCVVDHPLRLPSSLGPYYVGIRYCIVRILRLNNVGATTLWWLRELDKVQRYISSTHWFGFRFWYNSNSSSCFDDDFIELILVTKVWCQVGNRVNL